MLFLAEMNLKASRVLCACVNLNGMSMKTENDYYRWMQCYSLSPIAKNLRNQAEEKYLTILKRVVGRIEGLSLLEIGPGKGFFASKAIEKGIDYCAIEKSKILMEALSRRNINVIWADILTLDINMLQGRAFDVVYLSHVIEHCDTRKEAEELIRKCRQLLAPQGYIVINAPNVLSYKSDFWIVDYTHNFVTTPLRIRNLLIDNGFLPTYENKTVLGVSNFIIRKIISFIFFICPGFLLNKFGKIFSPKETDTFSIYGHENFTVIARKIEDEIIRSH